MKSADTLFLFLLVLSTSVSLADDRPNILLIVADDLGYSDLGCYGGEIRTPHLDRLAGKGIRFTQFYNCGTGVLTRASLYSGLHPRLGPGGSTRGLLRDDMVTLAEVMRQAGYTTFLTGKWQLGAEAPDRAIDRGFTEFYGLVGTHCHHFNPAKPDPPAGLLDANSRTFIHNDQLISEFPDDFYSTDAFSDHAIEMIRRSASSRQPFFLNLCYTAPHYPIQVPAEDIARYRGNYRDGYDPLRERRFQRQIELGLFEPGTARLSRASLDHLYEYECLPWEELNKETKERQEARMEAYAAMVGRLDQGIGHVLAALEETNAASRTVVFFLSDNGGNSHFPIRSAQMTPRQERQPVFAFNRGIPVGDKRGFEYLGFAWGWAQNAPFRRYKNWTYEGGICTPMIVRWPGVTAAGTTTIELGHVVDFMPTLLELAGVEYPKMRHGQAIPVLEGRSLLPILQGRTPSPRSCPMGWELFGSRALREGKWKLLWDAGEKTWELYDLAMDRTETVDLAKRYPDRVVTMAAIWKKWAQRTGVPIR